MSATVVWDVDDVLNDLMLSWFTIVWVPGHPGGHVVYADLKANPPHEVLGMPAADYLASLDEFRLGAGYAGMAPRPEIVAWLAEHGSRCRHVALSATPVRTAPAAAAWVLRHFGRWIREFAFIPSPRAGEELPDYDRDKGSWLARVEGTRVLVDDSPANLDAAQAAGCLAVCWPQPWNGGHGGFADALATLTGLLDAEGAS